MRPLHRTRSRSLATVLLAVLGLVAVVRRAEDRGERTEDELRFRIQENVTNLEDA